MDVQSICWLPGSRWECSIMPLGKDTMFFSWKAKGKNTWVLFYVLWRVLGSLWVEMMLSKMQPTEEFMPLPSVWGSFWTAQPMWPSWESHLAGGSCRQSKKWCGVLFVVELQWFLYTLSTWCDVMQGGSNIFRTFLADTTVDECRIQCWSNL